MGLLDLNKAQSREKRLNTLSSYLGNSEVLIKEIEDKDVRQRIRTFSQTAPDEIVYAFEALNNIEDSVIVIHGPLGCSAAQLFFSSEGNSGKWYVTNLGERDSIMGGDEKLRQTVISAYKRHKPEVIIIVATPVVAINNDDIQAIILELEDELGVRIIPVYSDGFKSKTGINGYDVASHAIAKGLINPGGESPGPAYINLISLSENPKDVKEIARLLKEIGVIFNIIPRFSSYTSVKNSSKAKFSVALNHDEGNFLTTSLEEDFNIPFIKTPVPIGIENTTAFLAETAHGLVLDEAAKIVIEREKNKLEKLINSSPLDGLKIYIELPASVTLSIVKLVESLGGEVAGISIDKFDELNRDELEILDKGIQIRVADGQPFETANIFNKLKPDIYVGESGKAVWAAKQGIPTVSITNSGVYGFNGIYEFVNLIKKALKNKNLVYGLSRNRKLPYINSWLNKSTNWYVKQEVK